MKWFIYRKISKVKQEIKNNLENIKTLKNELKKKTLKSLKKIIYMTQKLLTRFI